MKPVVTWVLLSDSREARVVANNGVGKGFVPLKGGTWTAPPPKTFEDGQGVSHSRMGASQHRLAPRTTNFSGDDEFAQITAEKLAEHFRKKAFDQLIVVAEPKMLGHLRKAIDGPVAAAIIAEVAKDLIRVPIEKLPVHLADIIAA